MSVETLSQLTTQLWFLHTPPEQQELIRVSLYLYQRESESKVVLSDYSFIVYPMAKAYEGFLKQYLYDLQLINQSTFEGKRFRIGRALNPDVHFNQRDEFWLYDDLERQCGAEFAKKIWVTWLECRNQIFHFFPRQYKPLSLTDAAEKLELLASSMADAYHCQLDNLK